MADKPSDSGETQRQPLTPAKRKRLQQCHEHGSKMASQENFDYATTLFTECVAGDPGNFLYLQDFLENLKKKYKNNKKGDSMAFLRTAGMKAGVRKAVSQKDYAGAIKAGLEVLKLNPWDVGTLTAMADACDKGGFDDTQLLYLKMALESNPKDPDICRVCALALGKRQQYDQAIAMWHRVELARPGDEEAARHIASLAVEKTITQGNYEEADPSRKRGMSGSTAAQASAHAQEVTPEERLKREISRKPKEIPLYVELAEIFLREDRFGEAEIVYEKAYEKSDGDVAVLEKWEDVTLRRLRHEISQVDKRKAKEGASDDLQRRRNELHKDLLTKELEVYKSRAERYPNNLTFRYDLGVRYQLNRRFQEAIAEYQMAKSDPRRRGLCLLALGQCFQHIKQERLAMTHYEEAIKEIPDRDPDNRKKALYLAAKLAYLLGDYGVAERHATVLAGMDFSYKDVARLLDAIAKHHKGDAVEAGKSSLDLHAPPGQPVEET